MAIWYFLRQGPGQLRPLRADEMEAFLKAQTPLPADDESTVHYIGLEVAEDGDTVTHLGRVWFGRCTVREDGLLDQRAMLNRANARAAAEARLADWQPPSGVVVDARDAFEARRQRHASRWDPTAADLEALRVSVNQRAGWNIL
jgi:hypothetical protein